MFAAGQDQGVDHAQDPMIVDTVAGQDRGMPRVAVDRDHVIGLRIAPQMGVTQIESKTMIAGDDTTLAPENGRFHEIATPTRETMIVKTMEIVVAVDRMMSLLVIKVVLLLQWRMTRPQIIMLTKMVARVLRTDLETSLASVQSLQWPTEHLNTMKRRDNRVQWWQKI